MANNVFPQSQSNSLELMLPLTVITDDGRLLIFILNVSHCLFSLITLFIIYSLQRTSHLCIPRRGIARPQSQFPHHVSVSDFYIPRIGPHIFL
jgi:hypothetical protein